MGAEKPRKYRNKKVVYNGIKFDSKRECERYKELSLLEQAGVISDLQHQVKFPLQCGGTPVKSKSGRRLSFWLDFQYQQDGETVYEDIKGFMPDKNMLKIAVVEAEYGIEIRIVR